MEEDPKVDSLARAIRALTAAVLCLAAVVLAVLAFYLISFYRSASFFRGARSASAGASEGHADAKLFHALPPEEKIKRSAAILLTTHQRDGRKLKAVVQEVLKKEPNAELQYSVGDEFVELSRYGEDGATYGDGYVVFFADSGMGGHESYTYRNGRITGLGNMPLEMLRGIIQGDGAAPRLPAPSPPSAESAVTPATSGKREPFVDLEETTNGEGVTRVFSIPRSAAMRIPEWLPEEGEPPLSMSKAIRLATQAAQAQSSDQVSFVARAVRIQLASCDEPLGNRWYYVLDCVPREKGGLGMDRSFPVVVLMDGSVVTGRIKR